jgi:HK97 family phage prohead protease
MSKKIKYDFSGYATKNNLKCSDGRVIRDGAFKHQDGEKVPLVWQHFKKEPSNVLGHAILEHREDGVYAYCTFNETESGTNAKTLVRHGDIERLSIHANQLKQVASDVMHGMIREVSLVISGANPGAVIDNIAIEHADGTTEDSIEDAIIHSGETIKVGELDHADGDKTVGDVLDTLSEDQKKAVYAVIANAMDEGDAEHSDDSSDGDDEELTHKQKNEGGTEMKTNVFDQKNKDAKAKHTLTHEDFKSIMELAKSTGSLKDAFGVHLADKELTHEDIEFSHDDPYGIGNIDYLFPDAQKIRRTPDFVKREDSWVTKVYSAAHKSPFSRIKSLSADITADEARAKGYIKGNLKKEEYFALSKRTTTPTTIYKKQKLERDDIIDITDMNVVAWLKAEMRMMLNEEIARAILTGDGREGDDDDKVNESNIRPIVKDADFYNHKVQLAATVTDYQDIMDAIIRARKNYKGTGRPTLFTTADMVTEMLLIRDTTGRKIYNTEAELAAALRVKEIVEVEVMENLTREDGDDTYDVLGVMVNMTDYTVGADKGGKISMFDDFDIDYNQYKYLMEGRMSGCLTRPKSALTIERLQAEG